MIKQNRVRVDVWSGLQDRIRMRDKVKYMPPSSYTSTLPAFSNMSGIAAAAVVPFQPGTTLNFAYAVSVDMDL